jgi:hypothetical protein
MTVTLTAKASHTYGVLDPLVIERRDTKFLQASLSDALNVIMLPQGGYMDRGGSTRKAMIRRKLASIVVTAGMFVAPNGGTIVNLLDGNDATLFTTAVVAGDPFVLWTLDLGVAQKLAAVDLFDIVAASAERNTCVQVQWLDGVTWRMLGAALDLAKSKHRRRCAIDPTTGFFMARQLRMVITGGAGLGTISLSGLKLWTETDTYSDGVIRNFNFKLGVNYKLALSENSLDVFRDGVWKAAAPASWSADVVRAIKRTSDYATVLLFHESFPSLELQRQGSDTEWNLRPVPFTNIPRADYGASYANGVDEVQRVRIYGATAATDAFQLILDGNKTDEIQLGASWAITATNTNAKLELLAGVNPGLTVTSPATGQLDITFTGGGNAAKDWPQMEGLIFVSGAYISVSTVAKGKAAGEDIFSATRGYIGVGRFAQERLLAGGITERPATYLASVTSQVYNFDQELSGAAASLSFDISGESNSLRDFFISRTIVLFTDSEVYHLATPVLSATDTPELFRSDAPGIDQYLPVLSLGNALYYMQRGGQTLIKLDYDELKKNFLGVNASVLSASLVNKPIDWCVRRSTESNDSDLLMYINQDGRLVTLTLMSEQDVSGFAPHQTTGEFKSICVDGDEVAWWLVKRDVSGEDRLILERMEPDMMLDGAIEYSFELATSDVLNLEAFEGQEVWAVADGVVQGPFDVTGGAVHLDTPATTVRVGTWIAPFATDTDFVPEEDQKRPMARLKRVFGVDVSVKDTTSLALIVNGNAAVPFVINAATTDTLVTEGWPGFTVGGKVTTTQTRPGRKIVRMVKKRIAA